jgi:biopolymer transport protein ExbD
VQTPELQVVLSIVPTGCRILDQPAGDGLPTDCRVSLNEQEIPATDLPVRVAEILGGRPADRRVLFLAADDRLNYEGVLRIVDLAKSRVDDLQIEFLTTD